MMETEIVSRRRRWRPEDKAALLAEVEADDDKVLVVARRHGISESLLYNWRSAWKAAASLPVPRGLPFMPLGVIEGPGRNGAVGLVPPVRHTAEAGNPVDRGGGIDIDLPNGARIRSPVTC